MFSSLFSTGKRGVNVLFFLKNKKVKLMRFWPFWSCFWFIDTVLKGNTFEFILVEIVFFISRYVIWTQQEKKKLSHILTKTNLLCKSKKRSISLLGGRPSPATFLTLYRPWKMSPSRIYFVQTQASGNMADKMFKMYALTEGEAGWSEDSLPNTGGSELGHHGVGGRSGRAGSEMASKPMMGRLPRR